MPALDMDLGSALTDLIGQKAADVTVEGGNAWFNLYNAGDALMRGELPCLLATVVSAFVRLGLADNVTLCHECLQQPGHQLLLEEGRLEQKCDDCATRPKQIPQNAASFNARNAPMIIEIGLLAGCVSALLWATAWLVHDWVFSLLDTEFMVPTIMLIALYLAMGYGIAWPIGYVIRKIPGRGQRFASMTGLVVALLAVLGGEILYGTFLVWREFEVVTFAGGARAAIEIVVQSSFSYQLGKFVAAFFCLQMGWVSARMEATKALLE